MSHSLLHGLALAGKHRYGEALPLLESIPAEHLRSGFPAAGEALAESLHAAGRIEEAVTAHDTIAVDLSVDPIARSRAAHSARELFKTRAGRAGGFGRIVSQAEGRGLFTGAAVSGFVAPGLRAGVRGWHDEVSLSDDRILEADSGSRSGGLACLRHRFPRSNLFAEGRIGSGTHDRLTGGISVGRERWHWTATGFRLEAEVNARADDSLQVMALDGVNDRFGFEWERPVGGLLRRWELSAGARVRRLSTAGVSLGEGIGGRIELGRPILENPGRTRKLRLAYRGGYDRFDPDPTSSAEARRLGVSRETASIGGSLVEPEYHPHGLLLEFEARLDERLRVHTEAGVAYDLADAEVDYHFGLGAKYGIRDQLDFVIEGVFQSDGTGATNDESEVWAGSLGIQGYF